MALSDESQPKRTIIARAFSMAEDLVYMGLSVILTVIALTLLVNVTYDCARNILAGELLSQLVPLLDRILLILLIVEVLYTVQVSFKEHAVTPAPFLLVGLIAAIRRVLVLTAEFGHLPAHASIKDLILELAVLSGLIVSIAVSLYVLRRRDTTDKAPRA